MNRSKKWKEVVKNSKELIENFNNFSDDTAIVWADVQIGCYKEAMLALVRSNSNWAMDVSEEQELLIITMVNRAEAVE